MHAAKLNRVARHIRASAPPSDRQLLLGFTTGSDAAAFAALVGRHGPMVLRVSQRVLGHDQDAEDAFQATFLVLTRKAGTIRRSESLASWLHGVAYRIALRARRDAGRRRTHEREAKPMPANAGIVEIEWREIQASLDEEIRALPEKYRAPFVLCFLEGKTRSEAADELGLKEGTIWSRLAQARKLLQDRLGRRGIALPSLLAAIAMSESANSAVPVRLFDTTVRVLSADGVPARVVALAMGMSRAMLTRMLNAVLLGLVTTGLLAFGGVLLKAEGPTPPPTEGRSNAKPLVAAPPEPATKEPRPDPDPGDPKFAGRFSGQVNGPDGKPLAGARVFIVPFYSENRETGPVRATTDADGRFTFDAPDMTYTEFDGLPARREGLLIVTKDGYGPDFMHTWGHRTGVGFRTHFDPIKGAEFTFQLAKDDVPIHGRFLGPDGKPLVGARVRLHMLMVPREQDLDAHLDREKTLSILASGGHERGCEPSRIPGLTVETRTDADGRFTFKGLGRDRLAELRVSAPSVVDTHLTVMTRDAPDVGTRPDFDGKTTQVIHGASCTIQLKQGLTIKGVVRDRDTKAPVPDMWVTKYWNPLALPPSATDAVVTDEKGRFTMSGLDPALLNYEQQHRDITAIPRPGSQHHMAKGVIGRNAEVIIECARGIAFRLKLVDEQGQPVEGNVEYQHIDPNPQIEELIRPLSGSNWPVMNRAARRADGSYEGFVLPGPGAVLVVMPNRRSYRPAHVNPKAFFEPGRADWPENSFSLYGTHNTLSSHAQWIDQHDYAAIVLVNPKKDSGPLDLSATVVRDRPRQVSLIDPDDKPVVGAVAHLYEKHGPYEVEQHLRGSAFPLTGLQTDRDQRITFVQADRKLIGVLRARGDGDTSYTVRMQPWAGVKGRFVDADGKPLKDPLGPGEGPMVENDAAEGSKFSISKFDEEGRFRIDGLVPGQSYSCVRVYRQIARILPAKAFEKLVLRSGEVRDVGDIRIMPPADRN